MIGALRRSLFGWVGRGILTEALMVLLVNRLGAIAGRMERLMARFLAGTLVHRAPRACAEAAPVERAARAAGVAVWPREFGWLLTLMTHHAALYHGQLRTVLGTPEMVALLAACPQAVRILRPMCRMLGIETSVLRAPVVRVPRVRVRKPRVPVDWGRIPLPRGVLSAVRRLRRFEKGD